MTDPRKEAIRQALTDEVIRAVAALRQERNVCREQDGKAVFVTGVEAAREYLTETLLPVWPAPDAEGETPRETREAWNWIVSQAECEPQCGSYKDAPCDCGKLAVFAHLARVLGIVQTPASATSGGEMPPRAPRTGPRRIPMSDILTAEQIADFRRWFRAPWGTTTAADALRLLDHYERDTAALLAENAELRAKLTAWERAADELMVANWIGVYDPAEDPKQTIHRIACGYLDPETAKPLLDEIARREAVEAENATLRAEVAALRDTLDVVKMARVEAVDALGAENATLRAERDEARQCAHDAAIETTTRLTEVEHWVRRYNELDQWRVSTKKRAEAAEAEVARLRRAAETRMREDGA